LYIHVRLLYFLVALYFFCPMVVLGGEALCIANHFMRLHIPAGLHFSFTRFGTAHLEHKVAVECFNSALSPQLAILRFYSVASSTWKYFNVHRDRFVSESIFDSSILEDGTDTMFRNVGTELQTDVTQYPR